MIKNLSVLSICLWAMVFVACESAEPIREINETSPEIRNDNKKETPAITKVKDGYVVSEDGTAKETPEAGKANVQGKVFFNEQPAADVEVKLCEKFSTFSGCSGEEYKTKTDKDGEYLFKNVDPKDYEGLLAKVFNTRMYIFATGSLSIISAKYKIEPDATFFAPPTNLFKSDLKIENPKSNAKVDAGDFEIKWKQYEDAAYYKFGLYPDDSAVSSPYINEKVEGESFKVEKPLEAGKWRLKIDAFNENDIKLSQLKADIEFTIEGGSAPKIDVEKKKDAE